MTIEEYEEVLKLIKSKLNGYDEITWEDIINKYGINMHPNTLAKASNTIFGGQFVAEYLENKRIKETKNPNQVNTFLNNKIENEKILKQIQTEKLEINRMLREQSRDELFEAKVIEAIKNTMSLRENRVYTPINNNNENNESNRCGILCFADQHYGKDFKVYGLNGEIVNSYNPDIFNIRMNKLFYELIDYIEKNNYSKIKVFNLGDSLDGFLRHSQLQTLKYGVVESAIRYSKYMADWLQDLSEYVEIDYYQTNGNHGELRLLDGLKGQHQNENIELITEFIIETINKDNPNLNIIKNRSGLIYTTAAGFSILGIHGEVKNAEKAINEFANIYKTSVDYLVSGHIHHNKYENCGARMGTISIGSIVGSDDYSFKLRKTSDATASFLTFEKDKGKVDEHIFVLN